MGARAAAGEPLSPGGRGRENQSSGPLLVGGGRPWAYGSSRRTCPRPGPQRARENPCFGKKTKQKHPPPRKKKNPQKTKATKQETFFFLACSRTSTGSWRKEGFMRAGRDGGSEGSWGCGGSSGHWGRAGVLWGLARPARA